MRPAKEKSDRPSLAATSEAGVYIIPFRRTFNGTFHSMPSYFCVQWMFPLGICVIFWIIVQANDLRSRKRKIAAKINQIASRYKKGVLLYIFYGNPHWRKTDKSRCLFWRWSIRCPPSSVLEVIEGPACFAPSLLILPSYLTLCPQ